MKRLFVPTNSAEDWKPLLAKPDRHWKAGYSAMTAALAWEAAGDRLPPEIQTMLDAGPPALQGLELLAAFPEWPVALPGGLTSSQTDVLAVARNNAGVVVLAVEAKVDEAFGPTLAEKRAEATGGQSERLDYLHRELELRETLADTIRYQLVHRSVSALLMARAFHAQAAIMLVHSFSPTGRWKDDFDAFAAALGTTGTKGQLLAVPTVQGPPLYIGWCPGDQRFRTAVSIP
jgi:hypothetical protein